MQHDYIIFQLATHYLPKIALRLERLFIAVIEACEATHPVIHHYALKNIIEIIKLIEKPELKSRFVKELMHFEHLLNRQIVPYSNDSYAQLFVHIQRLNHMVGRFGGTIHQDPFIQSIRLAQSAHHSDCELHAPQLFLWLESSPLLRQRHLTQWLSQLQPLSETAHLYLTLLRNTTQFEPIELHNGFYQRSLPAKSSCQLIQLRMSKESGLVPKMQIGHHGLSLRLCDAETMQETQQTPLTVDLAICQLG